MLRVAVLVGRVERISYTRTALSRCSHLSSFRVFSSWNGNDNLSPEDAFAKDDAPSAPSSVDAEIQKQVLDKCAALHASVMPLNEKVSARFSGMVASRLATHSHLPLFLSHSSFGAHLPRIRTRAHLYPLSFLLEITVPESLLL